MKYNYQIIIEYDGTKFVGWQSQKNGASVQDCIQNSLKKYLKIKTKIIGSGRTDAGVHAIKQYANFFINKKINDKNKFIDAINYFLEGKGVSVLDIKNKNLKFNSRFSAKKRIYKYIITNRQGTLSISRNRSWLVKKKLNVKLMKRGAKMLNGTHDFSTFRAASCSAKSPIKKIDKIRVYKNKNDIILIFESKSFLQNQVRSMVGSLKFLGEGKWKISDFAKAFKSKKRANCATPAPAYGLYLFDVKY